MIKITAAIIAALGLGFAGTYFTSGNSCCDGGCPISRLLLGSQPASTTDANCCQPGADCCNPPQACCGEAKTKSCCSKGAPCCEAGDACCDSEKVKTQAPKPEVKDSK